MKVRDGRNRTVKHRIEHCPSLVEQITSADQAWLRAFPQVASHAGGLQHCLTTRYRRFTLALPDGAGRVTVDRELVFAQPAGEALAAPGLAIIETKGAGRPTAMDRALWRSGYRPVSMSKFAVGMSLLRPELPANRWNRIRARLIAGSVGSQVHPMICSVAAPALGGSGELDQLWDGGAAARALPLRNLFG